MAQQQGPAGPREAVFHVHAVSKVYRMGDVEVHALRGVDVDLFAGELVVLLGPSGSGKSTLLNILGGLDVPTSGDLRYRDLELTAASEADLTLYRRNTVGFVFQFYNLIPSLTARENVALITEIARDPMPAEAALEMVNLGARLESLNKEYKTRIIISDATRARLKTPYETRPLGDVPPPPGLRRPAQPAQLPFALGLLLQCEHSLARAPERQPGQSGKVLQVSQLDGSKGTLQVPAGCQHTQPFAPCQERKTGCRSSSCRVIGPFP